MHPAMQARFPNVSDKIPNRLRGCVLSVTSRGAVIELKPVHTKNNFNYISIHNNSQYIYVYSKLALRFHIINMQAHEHKIFFY